MLRDADVHPVLFRFEVFGGVLVALEDRDPEPLGGDAEVLGEELPGPLDGLFLEVVPEGEVAEHLEEGQVARVADLLYIRGAEALLGADRARSWRESPGP